MNVGDGLEGSDGFAGELDGAEAELDDKNPTEAIELIAIGATFDELPNMGNTMVPPTTSGGFTSELTEVDSWGWITCADDEAAFRLNIFLVDKTVSDAWANAPGSAVDSPSSESFALSFVKSFSAVLFFLGPRTSGN
jgi:hypothetical protein